MTAVITGEVVICRGPHGCAFVLEVHNEDEECWGGYARGLDPYASFKTYRKDQFILIEDRRNP